MSKRGLDTSILANEDIVAVKPQEQSEELKTYLKMYKEFNKGDFLFNESLELFSVYTKLPKTKESKVYQVCSLIYPSNFYNDSITQITKIEVTL